MKLPFLNSVRNRKHSLSVEEEKEYIVVCLEELFNKTPGSKGSSRQELDAANLELLI